MYRRLRGIEFFNLYNFEFLSVPIGIRRKVLFYLIISDVIDVSFSSFPVKDKVCKTSNKI